MAPPISHLEYFLQHYVEAHTEPCIGGALGCKLNDRVLPVGSSMYDIEARAVDGDLESTSCAACRDLGCLQ